MEKIKSSELFKKMVCATQEAFISENEQVIDAVSKSIDNNNINCMLLQDVTAFISLNNEFLRVSFIKAICSVLSEYGIIENDINIDDIKITNNLLKSGVHTAIYHE